MTAIQKERWLSFNDGLNDLVRRGCVDGEIHPDDIKSLAAAFKRCRENVTGQLRDAITELRNNDPLNPAFLPVSLLGVLHGTGLRETAHTRILTWILNPNGNHGFGDLPLRAFLAKIVDENWPQVESLRLNKIHAERTLKNTGSGRRIDVWIEGQVHKPDTETTVNWLVVIEAKVEIDESENQLADYEEEARKYVKDAGNAFLEPLFVFLTKDGHEGTTSAKGKWQPLSFQHITEILWCATQNNPAAPGFHLVRYYLSGILSDIYGWPLPMNEETTHGKYAAVEFIRSITQKTAPTTESRINSMIPSSEKTKLGEAISFYAQYPEEMDMASYAEESPIKDHFPFLSDEEYSALVTRAIRVEAVARQEAKAIIDLFAERVESIKHIKLDPFKRQGNWLCRFRCYRPVGKQPAQYPIEMGMEIETDKGQLISRSWIWVRGTERNAITKIISPGSPPLPETPRDWSQGTLILSEENLLNAATRRDTQEALADLMAKPFLSITPSAWSDLFSIAKK